MKTPSSTFNAADGRDYELQMGRWSRRLAETFLDFVGTGDAEQVLDVGCGDGALLDHLMHAMRLRCPICRARFTLGSMIGVPK